MGNKMIVRKFKECREKSRTHTSRAVREGRCTEQYISAIERGINFPYYNRLVRILNILGVSADAAFCDVLDHAAEQQASELSTMVARLPLRDQRQILDVVELLVKQAEGREETEKPEANA